MYDRLTSPETATASTSPAPTGKAVRRPATRQHSDLVQRQEQFAALAMSVAGSLYAAALRWSGSHAHAEDLVQETHLRAWRNFDRFALGTCFRAWVFKILCFVVWSRRRSAASRQVTMDFLADESLLGTRLQEEKRVEPFGTDWESVIPDLVSDALKHALECLSPGERALALCIPLGGLSYQECADEFGIPMGTVMSRYSRARARLRQALRGNQVGGMRSRNAKFR
jgi:RNA polymerase sigma-70 factor, ECF subfamily